MTIKQGIIGEHEPATSRESYVRAALMHAYRGAESVQMNSADASVTGRCLSDAFTSDLEVQAAVEKLNPLHWNVVDLWFRLDCTVEETAARLHRSVRAVGLYRHEAVEELIRILWNEPGYRTPPRYRDRTVEEDSYA